MPRLPEENASDCCPFLVLCCSMNSNILSNVSVNISSRSSNLGCESNTTRARGTLTLSQRYGGGGLYTSVCLPIMFLECRNRFGDACTATECSVKRFKILSSSETSSNLGLSATVRSLVLLQPSFPVASCCNRRTSAQQRYYKPRRTNNNMCCLSLENNCSIYLSCFSSDVNDTSMLSM